MNSLKPARLLLLLCLFTVCDQARAQSDSLRTDPSVFFSPDKILSFADFLWRQNDYRRAIDEYQRYLFSQETSQRAYASFQLGRGYLRTGQPDKAATFFARATDYATLPAIRDSAHVAHAAALLRMDPPTLFLASIDTIGTRLASPALKQRLLDLKTLSFLQQQQWGEALNVLQEAANPETVETLRNLAHRGQQLPRKSTWVAATMSTLIPGSGKLYAGRITDGLYSLIVIGGNAWLAHEGFRDHGSDSFKGWFFTVVGSFFYVGNIYGSVVAVRLYNQRSENALLNDVRAQINISTRF